MPRLLIASIVVPALTLVLGAQSEVERRAAHATDPVRALEELAESEPSAELWAALAEARARARAGRAAQEAFARASAARPRHAAAHARWLRQVCRAPRAAARVLDTALPLVATADGRAELVQERALCESEIARDDERRRRALGACAAAFVLLALASLFVWRSRA